MRRMFRLAVTLDDVDPPVWRRVLVPGGYTLDRVHRVLQYAMGWCDFHLHQFEIDGVQYGVPDPDGLLDVRDELDARLDAVAAAGTTLRYTYDFGDWWEHTVVVERVEAADLDRPHPMCLDGAGACPPEGCGGPEGYAELRAALADPLHPRHEVMAEWVGRPFDPEAFDAGRVSTLLRRLT